jgi:predicted sulfurtransferase
MNVQMNRGVNSSIDEVLRRGLTSIKPNAFKALAQDDDFLVLDVRTPQELALGLGFRWTICTLGRCIEQI